MSEGTQRRLAAIVSVDVVGYSRLMGVDEIGTLETLRTHRTELIDALIAEHGGRIVKTMGDGLLLEFPSVVQATQCVIEFQQGMAERNQGIDEDRRITFRIGVNLGDIIIDGEDILGDGVNIAARLQEIAEPGGVAISGRVHDDVRDRLDAVFKDTGEQELKNIARPVQVWHWSHAATSIAAARETVGDVALPLPDKPSIAVLPFNNMSSDPEQEYFADGISEDIITDLSKIASLFVIARNSSFVYKGKLVDVPTVAKELGVRFILEGSVRRGGSRVRVNAQLIDAETGGHLWAERYDRELTDIFAVQDEVTANIVQALAVTLGEDEERRVGKKGTDNLVAYECVLRGRELFMLTRREEAKQAKEILEQAIELDAGFGVAYAYLALTHMLDYTNGWSEDPQASQALAYDLAKRGVELTPDDAHAHIALGSVSLSLRRHEEAIAEAERAVQLDPNYAHGLFELGWYLQYAGRAAEALGYFDRAVRLDPHHADIFLHFMAQAYFQLDRYDEAVELLRRRLVRNPQSDSSRMLLAACYGCLEKHDAAHLVWDEIKEINPDFSIDQRRQVLPYKNSENFEQIVNGLRKAGLPV